MTEAFDVALGVDACPKNYDFYFEGPKPLESKFRRATPSELLLCFDFSINLIFREIVGLKPGLTRAARDFRLQHLQGPGNATIIADTEESLLVLKRTTQE